MPLSLTLPPVRALGDSGDYSDANLFRAALIAVQDAINTNSADISDIQANYLRGKVAAVEPAHDGSQEDGDLWVKPT